VDPFYAHSGQFSDLSDGQPLRDHLLQVAALARRRAEVACPGDSHLAEAAWAAGLLHDLGKYHPDWQHYLKEAAAKRRAKSIPHAIHGAAHAMETLEHRGVVLAVAGHHAGLSNCCEKVNDLTAQYPTFSTTLNTVLAAARTEIPNFPDTEFPPPFEGTDLATYLREEFWIRILFSLLVDADRLDTERFSTGHDRSLIPLAAGELLEQLDSRRRARAAKRPDDPLTLLRNRVFEECLRSGETRDRGFFELTVPTGGGKTFSGMAFALSHARRWNLRRVIVVIPYLSIIEQNAGEYRQIFGRDLVVEHHSAVAEEGPVGETAIRTPAQLATENWDAPIIVTTNVQFLESLLAASPKRCRKLHNIARSVVLFDEAQAMPTHILNPLMSVLRDLVGNYGTSIVFSTATQPAFRRSSGLPEGLPPEELHPILPAQMRDELFCALQRVNYHLNLTEPWGWETLIARLLEKQQGLCVLNTRAHARTVWEKLRDQVREKHGAEMAKAVLHLSSAMCAQHRLDVLGTGDTPGADSVRGRLSGREPCWLVSTQVIEAGVDVDFPRAFRALGPLESVVQVAGRCNREGLLKDTATGTPQKGDVFVFAPAEEGMPTGFYQLATGLARTLLSGEITEDQLATDPTLFASYFETLYARSSTDAKRKGDRSLQDLRAEFMFRDVAERARVIADGGCSVIVPYRASIRLIRKIRKAGFWNRRDLRRLQRYTVNLRPNNIAALQRNGQLSPLLDSDPDGPEVLNNASYQRNVGVVVDGAAPDDFLV
jgi:CRISPR-associated endonuclease/helicase Cas3